MDLARQMDFVTDRYLQFVEKIRAVNSLDELNVFMQAALEELGATRFAVVELGMEASPGVHALTNFPKEWTDRYFDKKYEFIDPVHEKLITTKTAFTWESLAPEGYIKGRGARVFNEGADFGIRNGCTIPILGLNGYTAVVSFASDKLDGDPKLYGAFHLMSYHFHRRFQELSGTEHTFVVPKLSPRERECLKWVGAGKTDWDIGEVLGIAASTVHDYVQSAMTKLGVVSRVQAVVASMYHHLIYVPPAFGATTRISGGADSPTKTGSSVDPPK